MGLMFPDRREFYHWRREVVSACRPNRAHFAIAALQRKMQVGIVFRLAWPSLV